MSRIESYSLNPGDQVPISLDGGSETWIAILGENPGFCTIAVEGTLNAQFPIQITSTDGTIGGSIRLNHAEGERYVVVNQSAGKVVLSIWTVI